MFGVNFCAARGKQANLYFSALRKFTSYTGMSRGGVGGRGEKRGRDRGRQFEIKKNIQISKDFRVYIKV